MTDTPNLAKLFQKLAEVTAAVQRIPKNGYNAHFGYHFATDADVSEALSEELSTRKIQTFVSVGDPVSRVHQKDNGKTTIITDVLATVTFACGETGATFTITMPGTGSDAEDKGTYKAITGAVKYALLKTFLIATGDDPENEAGGDTQPRATTVAQAPPAPAGPVPDGADSYEFKFGKHKGKQLHEVPADYLDWLLKQPAKEGYETQHEEQHAMFRRELYRRDQAAA